MQIQNNIKKNSTFKCCLSLFKLLNSQYWNNYLEWFYDFFFSIGFIGIYGFIQITALKSNPYATVNDFKNLIIGIITLEVVSAGSFTMPTCIMEIKTSVLMKRIGSTPIKPWMFIITSFIYYFLIIILVIIWMFFFTFLFFGFIDFKFGNETIKGMNLIFGNGVVAQQKYGINWLGMIVSLIYMSTVSIFVGLFNISTSKTSASCNIKSSMLYFISLVLSGMLFPLSIISNNTILNVFSYLTPFRYSNTLVVVSWLNGDIFNPNTIDFNSIGVGSISNVDVIISFIVPIIIILASVFVMIKLFKWNTR